MPPHSNVGRDAAAVVAGAGLLDLAQRLEPLGESGGDELARLIAAAAPRLESSAVADPDALAVALVDARGAVRQTNDRFARWVGDPSDLLEVRDLVSRARRQGWAAGAVRTAANGSLAMLAADGPRAARWSGFWGHPGLPGETEVVLLAFAPSRSRALVERAAAGLGLTPLEGRVCAALLRAASLDAAAAEARIGRETAKDALERALRRTGARRAQDLVGRLVEIACEAPLGRPVGEASALGLSAGERAVAARLALGETTNEAAEALNLSPATIKSYRRTIFHKLGVEKDRDLRRLMVEASELQRLGHADDLLPGRAPDPDALLRLTPAARDRMIAWIDYGPPAGRPLVLMHGYSTGRTAPPPMLRALQSRGFRVIVPQRPGFGHTSPAEHDDHAATGAADLARLADALEADRLVLVARDGGAATAFAFAGLSPDRLAPSLLVNPRMPRQWARERTGPLTALAVMLLRPSVVAAIGEVLARATGAHGQLAAMRRILDTCRADREAFADPAVSARLLDDAQRLRRRPDGFVAELRLFAEGWAPPVDYRGPLWRLALSAETASASQSAAWAGVIDGPPVWISGAGILAQFTHAEAIAELVASGSRGEA